MDQTQNRMGFLDGKANCMTKHWRENTWVLLQKQHIKGKYLEAAIPEGLHYCCKQICLNQLHPFPQFKKKEKIWLSIFTCTRNLITGFHWAFLQADNGCSSERPQWDGQNKTCHAPQKHSVESKKGIRCDSCLLNLMVSMTSKHTHECNRSVSAGHSSVSGSYRHVYVTKAFMLIFFFFFFLAFFTLRPIYITCGCCPCTQMSVGC